MGYNSPDDDAFSLFHQRPDTTPVTNGALIAVSPDARFVYVGSDLGVTVLERQGETLFTRQFVSLPNRLSSFPMFSGGLVVSGDGRHLYVVGPRSNSIVLFDRSITTGEITIAREYKDGVDGVDGLQGAAGGALSPDGRDFYVASSGEKALAVFRRDELSGGLELRHVYRNGEQGVQGLASASAVAPSPDGRHVYVTGFSDDAVVVFARNAESAELSPVTVYRDGIDGLDGLARPWSLTMSSDGRNVYVASILDPSVTAFGRDGDTGLLTFLSAQREGFLAVGPHAVVAGATHVHAIAASSDALLTYERHFETGDLRLLETRVDGVDGANQLDGPVALASDDEGYVYVASGNDDTVSLFAPTD